MSIQAILTQEAAAELLEMNEDDLHQLLGERMMALRMDPALSLEPSFDLEKRGLGPIELPPGVKRIIQKMVNTAIQQTYNVVCSEDPDYKKDRDDLLGALGLGGTALALGFSAFLVANFGLAIGVASVLATIVIKKIGLRTIAAGHKATCEELGKILPSA